MNMSEVGLRELAVLDAVCRLKNVSSAALELGLSQPAASNALRRLRNHFSDKLFVRTVDGMRPTPLADELMSDLGGALTQIDKLLRHRREFDPANSSRSYTIIMTDIGEVVFLQRIFRYLEAHAPGVTIRTKRLSAEATPRALESGQADLAIGFMPDLQTGGVYQQQLFVTNYVGIVRADHSTIGSDLSEEQYLNASHAVAEVEGTGHYVVYKQLAKLGVKSVGLRTTSFLALPLIVTSSNMLATVPRPLAETSGMAIRLLDLPLEFPEISIKQYWHERFDNDPGNRWLRKSCASLFQR